MTRVPCSQCAIAMVTVDEIFVVNEVPPVDAERVPSGRLELEIVTSTRFPLIPLLPPSGQVNR